MGLVNKSFQELIVPDHHFIFVFISLHVGFGDFGLGLHTQTDSILKPEIRVLHNEFDDVGDKLFASPEGLGFFDCGSD